MTDDPLQWALKLAAWLLIWVPSGGPCSALPDGLARWVEQEEGVVCWVHVLAHRAGLLPPELGVTAWEAEQNTPPLERTPRNPGHCAAAVNLVRSRAHRTPRPGDTFGRGDAPGME